MIIEPEEEEVVKRIGNSWKSIRYQVLFTVPNAGIFTVGSYGTTKENILRFIGAVPIWSMVQRSGMHQPFRS